VTISQRGATVQNKQKKLPWRG